MTTEELDILEVQKMAEEQATIDNGVDASTIEVSGVKMEQLTDALGRIWTVPADNVEDIEDRYTPDPLSTLKYDPRFHYQTIRDNQVPEYTAAGWAVVTRKELGVPIAVSDEYGKMVDSVYKVGDSILVKRPMVIEQANRKRKAKVALEALAATEPTQEAIDAARRAGFPVKYERKSSFLTRHGLNKTASGAN
jgi:hypothetical protein